MAKKKPRSRSRKKASPEPDRPDSLLSKTADELKDLHKRGKTQLALARKLAAKHLDCLGVSADELAARDRRDYEIARTNMVKRISKLEAEAQASETKYPKGSIEAKIRAYHGASEEGED